MNLFDPTMTVPPDVAAAADKLTNYFADLGFSEWRLNGVASRSQLEQAEADRAAFEAAGESARERLALRMEELQQAVLARLAAEAKAAQLMAALEDALDSLEYVENQLPGLAGYGVRQERITSGRAAIAAVKGEKPADDRSAIEEFVAVWFEATEEWVAVLPNGHVLRGKWGAVGYAVNAALEFLGRGEAEFDVLDLGGDGPTFRYVKNDEHWQEGGAPC